VADETKSNRRIIKKSETVREKAVKATEDSKQPRRLQTTKRRASAPFRVVGSGFRKLGKYKAFRIIGYVFAPPYFRNSWRELRQVTWTKRRDSFRLTFAVIAFAVVFGALVALLDFGLDKVFKQVLLK
jgi:preprotein translocase SecE subunit